MRLRQEYYISQNSQIHVRFLHASHIPLLWFVILIKKPFIALKHTNSLNNPKYPWTLAFYISTDKVNLSLTAKIDHEVCFDFQDNYLTSHFSMLLIILWVVLLSAFTKKDLHWGLKVCICYSLFFQKFHICLKVTFLIEIKSDINLKTVNVHFLVMLLDEI